MTTPVTAHTPLNAAIRDAGWRRNPTTGHLFDAAGRDLGVKGYEAAWVALWRAGAIAPDAAANVRDGGVIASGLDAELDELRAISSNADAFLLELEAKERQATGIANLKVEYNRVHGIVPRSTHAPINALEADAKPELAPKKQKPADAPIGMGPLSDADLLPEELNGRIAELKAQMGEMAKALRYEEAAKLRDRVRVLEARKLEFI